MEKCSACGAPIENGSCSYCGTNYQKQDQPGSNQGQQQRGYAVPIIQKEEPYQMTCEMMKKRIELIQPIQKRVFAAIESYAKSGGYDLVLDTAANATMLYHSESVDHTNKIIEQLK